MFRHFQLSLTDSRRWIILQRIWAGIALLLFAVTWRLWLPQPDYPRISLFRLFQDSPVWISPLALGLVVVALLLVVSLPERAKKTGWLTWAAAMSAMVLLWLLDQHRIQPWAIHLLLAAVVFMFCQPERGLALLRMLAISIYLYSAAGKFDHQFMHTVGSQFLGGLFAMVGLEFSHWDSGILPKLSLLLPAGEVLVGLMLCHSRTRPTAVACAVTLHLVVILILSPLGLNHEWGVLLWNGLFIVQVLLLFFNVKPADRTQTQQRPKNSFGQAVIFAALLLPLLEPFGLYDHWPSWGLYSPRSSRVTVRVELSEVHQLEPLQGYLLPQLGNRSFRVLDLSRWSLEALGAPVYPQDRFQLGVALAFAEKYQLKRTIEVDVLSMSNRFTGERARRTLRGIDEIRMACEGYRLNALPSEF